MPFISIIIPVFNRAGSLGRCLDSILNQSFTNIEILVIDDGSTDGSDSIINRIAVSDNRVHYVRKNHHGVSSARNRGIEIAHGKYLMFIDADDEIENNYLTNIVNKAISSEADILIWGIKHCSTDGRTIDWNPELNGLFDRKSFLSAFPVEQYGKHEGLYGFVSNKLVKMDILQSFGLRFDTTLSLMEDYSFFLDCYAHCSSFYCFSETGYHYIQNGSDNSQRHKDGSYEQLISVQTKCLNLLIGDNALTQQNESHIFDAIARLSLALFLEMKEIDFFRCKSKMTFLWENRFCIPALKKSRSKRRILKWLILSNNVLLTTIYIKLWRSYLSIRAGKGR